MAGRDDFDEFESRVERFEDALDSTGGAMASFSNELGRMREAASETQKDLSNLERGLSRGLRKAFDDLVFDGVKLTDALETVAQSMIRSTYSAALRPVTSHFGELLSKGAGGLVAGVLPFAKGAEFSQGRVVPFASGGVVSSPTFFQMRGGTGLMGEAGPEAILPLARGADGQLGVRGAGGGGVTVVMNVTTPDVQGFQRSQGQIAARMARAIGRGDRNR